MAGLIRVLIIIFLFYLIYRILKGLMKPPSLNRYAKSKIKDDSDGDSEAEELVRDPNCGIYIPRKQGVAALVGRRVSYFCSQECKQAYIENRKK